jgi:hypothetical protein
MLAINLNHMAHIAQEYYQFFPKTWVLPNQYDQLPTESKKIYIVKPHANCQGRGIYLTN